jgi:hypothetical protein
MKKTIAIFMIAVFAFSLFPLAFANEDADAQVESEADVKAGRDGMAIRANLKADMKEDRLEVRQEIKDRKEDVRDLSNVDRKRCMEKCTTEKGENCEARCRAMAKAEDVVEVKHELRDKAEDFREKSRERLAKIEGLDQKQIDRLSELGIENVEKIAALKAERLAKLSDLEKEKLEKFSHLSKEELEKLSIMTKARLEHFAGKDPAMLKAELKTMHVMKIKDSEDLFRRKLTDEQKEQFRARFEAAKEKLDAAKDELRQLKDELKEAREEGDDARVLERAKEYVVKTADALISHLEKIKSKAQESENLDAETAAKITAEIDVHITEIKSVKAEAEAAATKDELKAAAKKLREKWATLKHFAKVHSERVISARVEGAVNQGVVLEKRLEHILAKAKETGVEVNVEAEVEQFSSYMSSAKDSYEKAQAKLKEAMALKATDAEKARQLASESKVLLDQSKDSIKKAHDVLKEILRKIKEAYPQADLSEEVEIEVVEESQSSEASAEVSAEASTSA